MNGTVNNKLFTKANVYGMLVFVLSMIFTQYFSYQRYLINKSSEQNELANAANISRERIQEIFNHNESAIQTLAFVINKYGVPDDFDSLAASIIKTNKNIDALQLVKGGKIIKVFPLAGNEKVIGYNILLDPRRNIEALKSIESKSIFFSGPFELLQGGMGMVGRLPIFINNEFWGFSACIIKLNTFIEHAGIINSENSYFSYQLSKINPNTGKEEFFLNGFSDFNFKNSLKNKLNHDNLNFYISKNKSDIKKLSAMFVLLGVLLSTIAGLFTYNIVKKPEELAKLVREKTNEIYQSEYKYRTSLSRITDGFVSLDKNWCYTYMNKKAGEIFNRNPTDMIGKHIWTEFPEGIGQPFHLAYEKSMKEQVYIYLEEYYPPYDKWFENHIYPSHEGLSIYFRDITLRKKHEIEIIKINEQLKNLSNYLQTAIENERTHIAREIHDELGQLLTGIKMDASWIRNKNQNEWNNDVLDEKAIKLLELIDKSIVVVRKIAKELRPGVLDNLGLEAAIEWQANEFENKYKIRNTFNTKLDGRNFDDKINTTVFRIYQETLTNIARHANASNVVTNLEIIGNNLELEVIDDGIGINNKIKSNEVTYGLLGMKERTENLGGKFSIENFEGGGTIVKVNIPLS